jgi:S-adenosylmethionine decarboxylase
MKEQGTHICIDLVGCSELLLNDSAFIETLINKAIKESGFTLVEKIKLHKFDPQGVTGYALLSCSHIAIHTWPEYNYASVDVFACDKKEKVVKATDILLDGLKPKKFKKYVTTRGFIVK